MSEPQINQSDSGYDSEPVKQDTPVTQTTPVTQGAPTSGYDSEPVKQDTTVQNGVLQTPEELAMSQDKSIGPEERQFLNIQQVDLRIDPRYGYNSLQRIPVKLPAG